MARKVDEWVGRTDDSELSNEAYARLWRAQKGRCPKCTRFLRVGNITKEHLVPIWGGGENRESNIQLWCSVPCSSNKTAEEAPRRARADRQLARHLNLRTKKQRYCRPLPGTKRSGWKHKLNGQWERR